VDTEFVAEHTYRPQLCLIQVSAAGRLTIIDTQLVRDLIPFWELLANGEHEVVVHAGREEVSFSLTAIGAVPAGLFDVQIAAALIGLEYPAGYGSLAQKLLGETPKKGETRTDWRRRPLSDRQLRYALNDVIFLEPMRDALQERLEALNRTKWLTEEMEAWIQHVCDSHRKDRWRRVSGISGLSPRNKAIVRELWYWREEEAERRDLPPRRVLRDDLIVELAKRGTDDPKRIRAVRGMGRSDLQRALPKLAACVRRGLEVDPEDLPKTKHRRPAPPQLTMLGQFLSSALASICHRAKLAPSIVGNPTDVRDLVAYRLGYYHDDDPPPALATGWRAEVVGSVIDDLLSGKLAVRITDPQSDEPLAFESDG
jgi:ribonuclease D